MEKKALTVKELFNILPLGRNKMYQLINSRDFPKIKVGRKILIPKEAFDKWLEENVNRRFC